MLLSIGRKNLHEEGDTDYRDSMSFSSFKIRIFHKTHIASNVTEEKASAIRTIAVDVYKFCVTIPAMAMCETGLVWNIFI